MIENQEVELGRKSSYKNWAEKEGIPVINDFYVPDIRKVPLEPWPRLGGFGAFLNLVGTGDVNDAYFM